MDYNYIDKTNIHFTPQHSEHKKDQE